MLTDLQARFVDEYLIDLNGAQAAIRAGSKADRPDQAAYEFLRNPEVAQAIAERSEKRTKKLDITAEKVLAAIAEIAFGDVRKMFRDDGSLIRPHEWDDETAAAVAGMDVVTTSAGEGMVEHVAKIKRTDRLRALDMLARHHALYNDKLEVTVTEKLADRLDALPE